MKKSEILEAKLRELEDRKKAVDNEFSNCHKHTDPDFDECWSKFWKETLRPMHEEKAELEFQINREKNREIEVGDGVTYRLYSDSYACTVIKRTAKTLTIQRDKATLDPGFKPEFILGGFSAHCTNSEEQSYTYERNPNGEVFVCHWSEKKGRFQCGEDGSVRITRGRHEYYDYNY